jgi:hypothetical protein
MHVHGGAHAELGAPAGFDVFKMPEPAPGIRTVFWQLPARVRSKSPAGHEAYLACAEQHARVTAVRRASGTSACGVRAAPELAVLFAERAFYRRGETIAAQQVR